MPSLAEHSVVECAAKPASPRGGSGPTVAAWIPLILLVVLVAGVFLLPRVDLRSDLGYEMMNVGESLARDGTFSNPFSSVASGPTATYPPLYPLLLALYIKVFRDVPLVLLAAGIISIFASAATAVLLHSFVRRLLGSVAATFATGLWLATAWLGSSVNWVFWDAGITPLLLLGFCHATLYRSRSGTILAGTLLGELFLINPVSLMVAAAWWLCSRISLRRSALIFLIAAVIGAPWLIRNYALWGRLIARENFGFTFYASNNPCAKPHLGQNFDNCSSRMHPNGNPDEVDLIRRIGEPEYNRIKMAAAWDWIRANLRRFANLTATRVLLFWFPWPFEYRFQSYATWLVTLLSIPGLLWMRRDGAPLAAFVLAAAVLYPAVYYIVVADIRYRAPFAWVAVIPAAYLCDRIYRKVRQRHG